ncbi:MAG: EamA family transporter [Gemmatimonadaceae bacterium]|nr:EamA family transporter [Chitinophagaceae bacterium]
MENLKQPSKLLVLAAFAALYIIWGSTYLAIAIALKDIPPFLMAGARFFIAGILLYAWARFHGEKTPSGKATGKIALSGFLMVFMGTGSLVWAEQYLPSGIAAIVVATLPLWFVIMDKRQWSNYFSNKIVILGLLIGFAGVMMLFGGKNSFDIIHDKNRLAGFLVLMFGTICWAIGSLYSKYSPADSSTAMKASIQMITAGFLSLVVGFVIGEHHRFSFDQLTRESVFAVIYLITFGSLIGYMSYVWLLSVRPPSLVGTYAYVNPVVAVFLGWLIADEIITRQQIIALIVILAGVIMVGLFKDRAAKPQAADN